ncbi:MAG: hypothetical protein WAW30_01610 [Patescibacteria group bacterium]
MDYMLLAFFLLLVSPGILVSIALGRKSKKVKWGIVSIAILIFIALVTIVSRAEDFSLSTLVLITVLNVFFFMLNYAIDKIFEWIKRKYPSLS